MKWYFLKIILQISEENFDNKKDEMIKRFVNASSYQRPYRDQIYTYEMIDVKREKIDRRDCLIGRITRSPKVAHGRKINSVMRTSIEATAHLKDVCDSTEFIYDLNSCQLAVHDRYPFGPTPTTRRALKHMVGKPREKVKDGETHDVHVGLYTLSEYTEEAISGAEKLSEVKISFAKPNPGSGNTELDNITIGLISETIGASNGKFEADAPEDASLDKRESGFIRRSIRGLQERGYLRSGFVILDGQKIDLLKSAPRTVMTSGFDKIKGAVDNELLHRSKKWVKELRESGWPFDN